MLFLYILRDDWLIFMVSDSNQQPQQQLEYTLLKPDCHSWWISKMQSDTLEERYAIELCFKLGKNATETYEMLQTAFRPSCMNRASVFEWHKRFKEGRESVRDDERCGRSKEVNKPEMNSQRVRVTMLRFWGSSGRDSVGRGQHSSNPVSGISTRTMHQSTTPSLSQTIWSRGASTQFLSLPIVQTLFPVTFVYSQSSEAVVMRQLRRWERLWRRSLTLLHKRISMGPSEIVVTVQQVHCSRRRLLRRGIEFHVCTVYKSAHTKKVWKIILCTSWIHVANKPCSTFLLYFIIQYVCILFCMEKS